MKQKLNRFKATLCPYNQTHHIPLGIAVGYGKLCKGDTITNMISRADSIMYDDKHKQKKVLSKDQLKN